MLTENLYSILFKIAKWEMWKKNIMMNKIKHASFDLISSVRPLLTLLYQLYFNDNSTYTREFIFGFCC
ncbi:hypothetical protein SORBI_3008G111150 [Sorghum bicolor]|uniref:Uncharacterized protein n=1 Tax=Sorghum bicolor TaxID=4558 RepID=A0A1Z5R6L1_SORBI|nr:hypothetical protein SORBI_3008G111150 [Sorghum bicolor]